MRAIGNVLWLVLVGWWLALAYILAGIVACLLIITIPFGIASFRLANYALWPFGRQVIIQRSAGVGSLIGNIVWILLLGWELFLFHLLAGVIMCLTIIGIPFGLASFKLAGLSLMPLGTAIVPADRTASAAAIPPPVRA